MTCIRGFIIRKFINTTHHSCNETVYKRRFMILYIILASIYYILFAIVCRQTPFKQLLEVTNCVLANFMTRISSRRSGVFEWPASSCIPCRFGPIYFYAKRLQDRFPCVIYFSSVLCRTSDKLINITDRAQAKTSMLYYRSLTESKKKMNL